MTAAMAVSAIIIEPRHRARPEAPGRGGARPPSASSVAGAAPSSAAAQAGPAPEKAGAGRGAQALLGARNVQPRAARAHPPRKDPMKITGAKVIVCSPGRNFVTLKLETDAGVYGLGDATLNGREKAVVAYLEEHCLPALIG